MKKLEQIKNDVAKEKGYGSWFEADQDVKSKDGVLHAAISTRGLVNKVAELYAKQCIEETIEIANAHSESGCFDKEGALSNSLNLLK